MNQRVVAGLLALGLVAVLGFQADQKRVPFTSFSPGPTVNVLSSPGGRPIVQISGHKTYPDTGALRLVTVYVTGPQDDMGLWTAMSRWIDPDVAVLPKDAVYKPQETNKTSQAESAQQMTSSQDAATAAALGALGTKFRTQVQIGEVTKGGASDGLLKKGDVVRTVNGRPVADSAGVVAVVKVLKPGSKVRFGVTRDGRERDVVVTTRPDKADPKVSKVNVGVGQKFVFPFKVAINLGDNIGGPSAGMMFALSIYDLLTPGSLTGGKVIAGSGEIAADGTVGPIGGIGQKLVGAQRDGAKLFLVAQENCKEAASAHFDSTKMRLVKVHKLADAIAAVDAWRKNPDADLARCS